jgi:hypothetical protein
MYIGPANYTSLRRMEDEKAVAKAISEDKFDPRPRLT